MLAPLLLISVLGSILGQDLTDPELIGDIFGQQEGLSDDLCIESGGAEVCSGRGTCDFGMCTCEAGCEGRFCELCPAILVPSPPSPTILVPSFNMCSALRPCVECLVFNQYWKHFISAYQCKQHCESEQYQFKMGPKPGQGDECRTNEDCMEGKCKYLADAYCECEGGYCEIKGGFGGGVDYHYLQDEQCNEGRVANKLEGEGWVCSDGCNTCSCSQGQVAHTMIMCPPIGDSQCQDFPDNGKVRQNGEMWACPDGCNTCTCNHGAIEKTERFCQEYGQEVFTKLIPLDASKRSAEVCRFHGNLDGDNICPAYTFEVEEKNGKDIVYVERPPCLADDLAVNDAVWRGEQGDRDGHKYAHGFGDLQYPAEDHLNREKYQGHMEWGQKQGYGTVWWNDGSYFSGQFSQDAKEGEGTLFYANGDVYTGVWHQEKKGGNGEYVYNQGGSYMGQFSGGMKEGDGVNSYKNEDNDPLSPGGDSWEVFQGSYTGNQRTTGQFKFSQGNIFEGEFSQNNKFTGKGIYVWACGKKYVGDFVNGHPEGEGKLTHPSGWSYQGHFQNGKFHGEGKFNWSEDNFFQGTFNNGKMTGNGQFRLQNGDLFDSSTGLYYPDHNDRSTSFEAQFDGKKLLRRKPARKDKRCHGQLWCCTKKNPCGEGEGDCNNDEDCEDGLVCGDAHGYKNTCPRNLKRWRKYSDCCINEVTMIGQPRCTGEDEHCCSIHTPCGPGEGDCDNDDDCQDGLTCDNGDKAPKLGSCPNTINQNWNAADDCCRQL